MKRTTIASKLKAAGLKPQHFTIENNRRVLVQVNDRDGDLDTEATEKAVQAAVRALHWPAMRLGYGAYQLRPGAELAGSGEFCDKSSSHHY